MTLSPELYTTPHQISDARKCLRKYAWNQVDKLPFVQSEDAAFGERGHALLEKYDLYGTPPTLDTPEGRWACKVMTHRPWRRKTLIPERKIECEIDGVKLFMRLDLSEVLPGVCRIWDYKSVKDLSKGWHNKGEALNDEQFISYCMWGFSQDPTLEVVEMAYIYAKRPVPSAKTGVECAIKSELRELRITRAEAVDAWARVCMPAARCMHQIRTKRIQPHDVPANPDACLMYGKKYPCPRIGQCNLTDRDHLSEGVDMSSFLEQMQKVTGKAPVAQAAQQPPATQPAAPASAESPAARMMAAAGAAKGVNPPPRVQDGSGQVVSAAEANASKIAEALDKAKTQHEDDAKVGRDLRTIANASDAELGRALRVLLAAYKQA